MACLVVYQLDDLLSSETYTNIHRFLYLSKLEKGLYTSFNDSFCTLFYFQIAIQETLFSKYQVASASIVLWNSIGLVE